MEGQDSRLRTVFLLSVADVFFGMVGALVCLIVLAGKKEDVRIMEAFDQEATCDGATEAAFRLTPEGGASVTAEEWLDGLPEDRFSVRWAVRPQTEDLTCYLIARQIASGHNRKLESRGATKAVLSVEFWPLSAEGTAP